MCPRPRPSCWASRSPKSPRCPSATPTRPGGWPDYLEQRLTAISARCRATHAVEEDELDRACGTVRRLAAAVGDRARPPFWAERVRIVALIEALNTLPNAIRAGWDSDYAEEARRRMRALLDRA